MKLRYFTTSYALLLTIVVAGAAIGVATPASDAVAARVAPPVAIDDPSGYAQLVLSFGPLGYWRLGEAAGSAAVDLSAATNDGTYVGPSLNQPGAIVDDPNTAVRFGGADYIEVPHHANYRVDEGSVQAWFWIDAIGSVQTIFSKDSNGFDTGGHLTINIQGTGVLRARVQDIASDHIIDTAAPVTPGQWHHVVVSFGSQGLRVYIDAVPAGTDPYTGGLATSSGGAGNFEPIAIGGGTIRSGDLIVTPVDDFLIGVVDEVAFFPLQLDSAQIAQLYNGTVGFYVVDEDAFLSVASVSGVLANDTDVEGDPLTCTLDFAPPNGASFNLNADGSFTYQPVGDFAAADSFAYHANDGSANSNTAIARIIVAPVNDAPQISAPSTQSTLQDSSLVLRASFGNAIVASDIDAVAGDSLDVALAVTSGTLKLGSAAGVAIIGGGDATPGMIVRGTLPNLNAAMEGLIYRPVAAFFGPDTLTVEVDDRGSNGSGGALAAIDTVFVSVLEVQNNVAVFAQLVLPQGHFRPGATPLPMFEVAFTNTTTRPETLQSIQFRNTTVGPGTPLELDANFASMALSRLGGGGLIPGGSPGPVAGAFTGGMLTFGGLEVTIAPGDTTRLRVTGAASLNARDGDVLDFRVDSPADMTFTRPFALLAAWPLNPGDVFPVDGMVAAQIGLSPVAAASFAPGSVANLAMNIAVPANGYETDALNRINIQNFGTARAGTDIVSMRAWVDDGDNAFDPMVDTGLGTFSFTGDRWELTGLARAVSLAGTRLFISVDVSGTATDNATIQLVLPGAPDVGLGMSSGNDGPIDQAVANPLTQSITSADRVIFTAVPIAPASVAPGSRANPLVNVVATNTYTQPKTLTAMSFKNATVGGGGQSLLDASVEALTLREDGNDNGVLDDLATDPVVGTAVFANGKVSFTGLSYLVNASQSRHLFLCADFSLTEAADGDVISAVLSDAFDVAFSDPTSAVAVWPVTSKAAWTIDGMVASQIQRFDIAALTLAPADGPVLGLDLVIPGNGYLADEINGLRIVNNGTSDSGDLSDVRVWRDGGDGIFGSGGGDDVEISPLVWTGSGWQTPFLNEPVPAAGLRIFVGVTVAAAPTDSATVQLALPRNGVTVLSGNDGPHDLPVASAQNLLLSAAPLIASLEATPTVTTIGQTIRVRMILRNVGGENISGIAPTVLTTGGTAVVTLASGPAPAPLDLAPAATDTVMWTYVSTGAGWVDWQGSAAGTGQTSGLSRASAIVASNQHRVFSDATDLDVFPIQSMPFLITQGQADVVPLSLTFSSTGADSVASNARVLGLRVRVEDGQGVGIVPADLFTRVIVSEGSTVYLDKATLETSGAEIDLTLAAPALIPQMEPVTLSLHLDIAATTLVPEFRLVVVDSSWLSAVDAINGAPITVQIPQGAYPIRSGIGRLSAPPTQLDVQGVAGVGQRVSQGQSDVTLLSLRLDNPGLAGVTTDVAIPSVAFTVIDSSGAVIAAPGTIFGRIRVKSAFMTYADHAVSPGDSARIVVPMSLLPSVVAGTQLAIDVDADVSAAAPAGVYRLRVAAAGDIDARVRNSGAGVVVNPATIPILGANVRVEAEPTTLVVSNTPRLPGTVNVGQANITAMSVVLRHPGTAGTGRIEVRELTFHTENGQRQALVPAIYLGGFRLLRGGAIIAAAVTIPPSGERVRIPLSGIELEPGDADTVEVEIDISPAAPVSFLNLFVDDVDVVAVGLNVGGSVAVAPGAGSFPFTSGLTQLLPPPTELIVDLVSHMPAALVENSTNVLVADLILENSAAPGAGPITIDHVRLAAADADRSIVALGSSVSRVAIYEQGVLLAMSNALGDDSTTTVITLVPPLLVQPGETIGCELRIDCQSQISGRGLRLGVDQAGIGVVQPQSALLQIRVEARVGKLFPMWTDVGTFNEISLEGSFSNFPNPFAAGGQNTTFVYYLDRDARVTLNIWTARGEAVTTVRADESRLAGLHQDDIWSGRNGRGVAVVNGVYLAELIVRYDDGGTQRILRKVAVVR